MRFNIKRLGEFPLNLGDTISTSSKKLLTMQTTSVTPTTFDPALTLSGGAPTPEWNMGDGTELTGASISHTYADAGTKTVTLGPAELYEYVTQIDAANDNLTVLPVASLLNLTQLFCQSNSLSALDVSALVNLTILNCGANSLSALDVSALVNLTSLRCYNNNLSVLDVSALVNLTILDCQFNNFSVLDVGALTKIVSFRCDGNGMTQSEVDAIIDDIYTNRASYTSTTPSLNIGGTNAAPSGTYQYSATPSTGKEKIYALVNDDDAEGFNKWTITYTA